MKLKKLLALCLSIVMVCSLVGCGGSKDTPVQTPNTPVETPTVSVETPIETPIETPVETPTTSDEKVEFQTVVDAFLKANVDGVGMLDMVGIFKDDELVEHIAYYDDALLAKAMKKNSNFNVISKATTLTVEDFSVLSRGSYSVSIKNDLTETCDLHIVKLDDKWVIDISELFVPCNFSTSNEVDVYINGVLVPKEYLVSKSNLGSAKYTVPYLLGLIENTVSYDTVLFGNYETVFVADGSGNELSLNYKLSVEDLEGYYPQIIDLWTKLNTAAHADDTAGVSALLSEDSQLSANIFLDGHNPAKYKSLTMTSLKPWPDTPSYMITPHRLSINLVAAFNLNTTYGTSESPTKYNSVVLDITDNGLTIFDCSPDVWQNSNINPYSDDN